MVDLALPGWWAKAGTLESDTEPGAADSKLAAPADVADMTVTIRNWVLALGYVIRALVDLVGD